MVKKEWSCISTQKKKPGLTMNPNASHLPFTQPHTYDLCVVRIMGMPARLELTVNVLCMLGIEFAIFLYFYVHFTVTDTLFCIDRKINVTVQFMANKTTDRLRGRNALTSQLFVLTGPSYHCTCCVRS
jgi:hypothetical protein